MKKTQKVIHITIALCIFAFLLTVFDFLALHDIHNEYVSTYILKYLDVTLSEDLPEWTSTKGEWEVVRISWLFRFIFFIFCVGVLYRLASRLKTKRQE